ncbi:MAG: O-antigen ligase family protein [Holophaga sp.]|nr:O-antigen ligase family protein [Holophaga sp.]
MNRLEQFRAGLAGWLRAYATGPRFLVLAAFLFAGDLKADPRLAWVPVDLTLLTGAVLTLVLLVRFLRGARLRSLGGPALLGAWFLSFVPGLFQAARTPYGFQKILTIFTFTLLSALAPMLLVDRDGDRVKVVNAMACFCFAITLGGLLGGAQDAQRLQAFGAGTISLGRATGLLFTYAAIQLAGEAPLPALSFGIMVLAGVAATFAGSRGPILAALVALALVFGAGRLRSRRAATRLLCAAGLFLAVLGSSLSLAPKGSLARVQAFFQGQYGESEGYRVNALHDSWQLIGQAPWGVGWGGFATYVDPDRGVPRQYPHNLLAETTLESGWICGAVTLAVLATALVAGWSRSWLPGGRVVFAGTVFYLINAMVSGDLNDNRPLFMFVGSALMLWGTP